MITPNGGVGKQVALWIVKTIAAIASSRHSWYRYNIRLSLKEMVHNDSVLSVFLFGWESWPTRIKNVWRPSALDRSRLRSIARVWSAHRVNNDEMCRRVLGAHNRLLTEIIVLHCFRWL